MKLNDLIIESSGNIFADLELTNPEERLAKAELAYKISEIISEKHLKQEDAAKLLLINQPKISLILNGKLSGFSLEKLIHYLNLLGKDVQLIVTDKPLMSGDTFIKVVSDASKRLGSLFIFPVQPPKHPALASKMPPWDYTNDYLANYI